MTILVHVPGVGLAVAGPTRCFLPPMLDGKDLSDPDCQLAALMCLYAHHLEVAHPGHEYTDDAAASFARLILEETSSEPPHLLHLLEP